MKITLPIGRHYKIDGKPSGRYSAAYSIEHMDLFYTCNETFHSLSFSTESIIAELVPVAIIYPLFARYSTSAENSALNISGNVNPDTIGFNLTATPYFVRYAEIDSLSIGFTATELLVPLLKKTVLNDFDGMNLAEMDDRYLYDLSYITIE